MPIFCKIDDKISLQPNAKIVNQSLNACKDNQRSYNLFRDRVKSFQRFEIKRATTWKNSNQHSKRYYDYLRPMRFRYEPKFNQCK